MKYIKDKWPVLILVILVIVGYPLEKTWQLPPTINTDTTQVLLPNRNIQTNVQQIKEHNAQLRDLLRQRITIEYTQQGIRNSSRQQMRGFYVLIIAGLLTLFISKKNKVTTIAIYSFMSIIAVMYSLEVHQDDLYQRYDAAAKIYSYRLYDFTSTYEDSTTWYYFSYESIGNQMKIASEPCREYIRKILRIFRPTAEQIALYYFPLIVLFWWRLDMLAKRKNSLGNT